VSGTVTPPSGNAAGAIGVREAPVFRAARDGRHPRGLSTMRDYRERLTVGELVDHVAYLRGFRGGQAAGPQLMISA